SGYLQNIFVFWCIQFYKTDQYQTNCKEKSHGQCCVTHVVKLLNQRGKNKSSEDDGELFQDVIKTEIRGIVIAFFRQKFGISRPRHRLKTAHNQTYNSGNSVKLILDVRVFFVQIIR